MTSYHSHLIYIVSESLYLGHNSHLDEEDHSAVGKVFSYLFIELVSTLHSFTMDLQNLKRNSKYHNTLYIPDD